VKEKLGGIGLRLLGFNVLLVFVPIAGLLAVDVFEEHFLAAQERSMVQQGRLLAAALAERGPIDPADAQGILVRLDRRHNARLRIVDPKGTVLADSSRLGPRRTKRDEEALEESAARDSWLYRTALGALRLAPGGAREAAGEAPAAEEFYAAGETLRAPEIQAALGGRYGAATRESQGQRSLTLYSAIPVRSDGGVVGAVLVTESTWRLLQDLYDVRLAIFQVFLASVAVAVVLSLFVATTIARPLARLRAEAAALLDRRGRLRGRFGGSARRDEIGDLARALEDLSRRLEQRSHFMDSFAADVSHAFKNPLAGIRSAAELLEKTEERERRGRFRGMVERDVTRLERLLGAVREIARIDAEVEEEGRERVPLGELLGNLLEAFRLRSGGRLRFALDDGSEGAVILASPERLAEAFENLVDNAASFAPPGSEVRVSLRREGNEVSVAVRDQGPGIPEEHLERVFDRFFSWRPDEEGQESDHMGLGLAIARAVFESYGGALRAANDPAGGACFEARVPVGGTRRLDS
jgi:two-component system, OmpR family, sensor histidine kinase ChvG